MEYFIYSKKHDRIMKEFPHRNTTREVLVNGEWRKYTEWNETGKSSIDDGEIVHKTRSVKGNEIRINGIIQGD